MKPNPTKNMKKIALIILAIIGGVFVLLFVAVAVYIAVAKPFGVKLTSIPGAVIQAGTGKVKSTYDHPLLTTEQESALESLGVDTRTLPTSVTPALIDCFTTKLGQARAKEIQGGSTITPADYFKAQSCL